jgi:taurine dioxygenase
MTSNAMLSPFGVEVFFDLSDDRNADELREAFTQNALVVARGQSLAREQQVAMMRGLGTVLDHVSTLNMLSNVRPGGFLGDQEVAYHSDACYTPRPMHAISLHAVRIEDSGKTSTKIASGIRAYELLPDSTRARLGDLRAMHLAAVGESTLGGRQRLADYPPDGPRAVHPVVITDPVTGRPSIFVPYTNTDHIVDLEPYDSQLLLDQLQAVIYESDNVYEHFWHDGDVVIWSNMGCHHARGAMPGGERTLNRVCTTDAEAYMYEESTRLIHEQRLTGRV